MNKFSTLFLMLLMTLSILPMQDNTLLSRTRSEDEAKRRSATVNAAVESDHQLVLALQQLEPELRGKPASDFYLWKQAHSDACIAWIAADLPKVSLTSRDLLFLIFEFKHGDAEYRATRKKKLCIAQNMEKLLPAVINWTRGFSPIFANIQKIKENAYRQSRNNYVAAMSSAGSIQWSYGKRPEKGLFNSYKRNKNAFAMWRIPKRGNEFIMISKVCPRKFKQLMLLNDEQLQFCVDLFNQRSTIAPTDPWSDEGDTVLVLMPAQKKFYEEQFVNNPVLAQTDIPAALRDNYKLRITQIENA